MASGYTGSGASSTRSLFTAADTVATVTASSARRTASAAVRTTPAANPQVPSCTTRTARPRSSPSVNDSGRASRRLMTWVRIRSTRRSACSHPRSTARVSAASASAASGRARKDSSTVRFGDTRSVYQPGRADHERFRKPRYRTLPAIRAFSHESSVLSWEKARRGSELAPGAPGHLLQRPGVAVGVGESRVLHPAADVLHLADVDATAEQLRAGLVDVGDHEMQRP